MTLVAWLVLSFPLLAGPLDAARVGTAKGALVVSGSARDLTHAYAIEKSGLVRLVLSTAPLEEEVLFDNRVLQQRVVDRSISAVIIQLDEERSADTTHFYDPKLPAGLEVRQIGSFTASASTSSLLAGRVVMDDDGFSFSYDATFEAPLVIQPQTVEPLGGDATATEHALWRLRQMEIPYGEEQFRRVVIDGYADAVELFLIAGMPPGTAGALQEAVERGHIAVVRLLLDRGADPNAKDEAGQSLVMRAVSNPKPGVLELLIAAGADVSAPNRYRVTPLAVAAEQGRLDLVSALLAAGAKVNARDTAGGTALSVAILRGYPEIVAVLLDSGADVQRDQEDLLLLAADKPQILEMLRKAIGTTRR